VHEYASDSELRPGDVIGLEGSYWLLERIENSAGEGPARALAKPGGGILTAGWRRERSKSASTRLMRSAPGPVLVVPRGAGAWDLIGALAA
jgi:hypothetical protein